MDKPTPETPRKINRVQIGLSVFTQVAALAIIVVLLNYLGFRYFKREDFSRSQKYSLSSQTKQVLRGLKKPLKMHLFFGDEMPIYGDVSSLLKEYQYASKKKKVEIEFIDQYKDFSRARDLQAKYKFGEKENLVILDYEGRTKFVSASDMADWDESGAMFGQAPRLKAFRGEEALTSAIIALLDENPTTVHVLTGHNEPDPTGPALATFKQFVERQNLKLESLNLSDLEQLPSTLRVLYVMGPKYDLSERELMMLEAFWKRNGRILIALDPGAYTPRLTAFLQSQGIKPMENRVLRTVAIGPVTSRVTGIVRDVSGEFLEGSPITKRLGGVNTLFLGGTQSLEIPDSKNSVDKPRVQALIKAAEGFWGETEFNVDITGGGGVYFDPKKDHNAPLHLAASVEQGGIGDDRVQVESSRMVVVGNADLINSDAITAANLDFALSAMNWLLDREQLIGVAPKVAKSFTLSLTEAQLSRIALLTMGAIPLAAVILGLGAWLQRRR